MKQTENYEQLLERFNKRTAQLSERADELYGAYDGSMSGMNASYSDMGSIKENIETKMNR